MNYKLKLFSLVFILILYFSCKNSKNHNSETAKTDIINSNISPLPELDLKYSVYKINPNLDTFIVSNRGTIIEIPKNAFLDNEGNPIKNTVQIKYREFTNVLEIYFAGISMECDSADKSVVFETSGMIDFNATSENLPVFPNPENKINVNMISFDKSSDMNIYAFDINSKKWKYIGKDKITQKNYDDELSKLPNIPPAPKKAGKNSFSVEDDTKKFPELSVYKNILFDPVDGKDCGFSGTEIQIKALSGGKYEVKFIFDAYGVRQEQICICYLAFKEGVDYDNAFKIYQKKYEKLIKKRKLEEEKLNKEWEKYYEIRKKYEDAGLLDYFMKKEIDKMKKSDKIVRTFQIQGFGLTNIDRPLKVKGSSNLIASFMDYDGDKLELNNIMIAVKGKNMMYKCDKNVVFEPSNDNVMWAITSDNRIAWFGTDDFKKISQTSGNYAFIMKVYNKKVESYEDVFKLFFLN